MPGRNHKSRARRVSNFVYGIRLHAAHDFKIVRNTVFDNWVGIDLSPEEDFYTERTLIANNLIFRNDIGLVLFQVKGECIVRNHFTANQYAILDMGSCELHFIHNRARALVGEGRN